MKDLTTLTDAELMTAYEEALGLMAADDEMGNYNFGAEITETWQPTLDRLEVELEKRNILVPVTTEECPF